MFDRFRWKLMNFMNGRCGFDDLNKLIVLLSFVFYILLLITKLGIFSILFSILFVLFLFRYFSRNLSARVAENNKLTGLIQLIKLQYQLRKEYRVFKCRSCGRNVRVPLHKGKVEVTCPSCGRKKIIRTGRKK